MNKKVLVISRNAWSLENSTGNTLSNVFSHATKNIEFLNVYCRNEKPHNDICKKYFCAYESEIKRGFKIRGKIFSGNFSNFLCEKQPTHIYKRSIFKKSYFLKLVRELAWKFCFKKDKLDKFLESNMPDSIYMHIFDSPYMIGLCKYIVNKTNANLVLWTGDDNYTNHFSINLFYWIYRLIYLSSLKKLLIHSRIVFCNNKKLERIISDKYPFVKTEILMKGFYNLNVQTIDSIDPHSASRTILFSGNILPSRYKPLFTIAKWLDKYNNNHTAEYKLVIYTQQHNDKKIRAIANKNKMIKIFPAISYKELLKIQTESSFLLHLESFSKIDKQLTKGSLSTKIADYLRSSRPIIAYGPSDIASIEYLKSQNCAICITNNRDYNAFEKALDFNFNFDKIRQNSIDALLTNHNGLENTKKLMRYLFK